MEFYPLEGTPNHEPRKLLISAANGRARLASLPGETMHAGREGRETCQLPGAGYQLNGTRNQPRANNFSSSVYLFLAGRNNDARARLGANAGHSANNRGPQGPSGAETMATAIS